MAEKGRAALGFIFITVLIDVIGLGIIIPVMPKLIADLIHGGERLEVAAVAGRGVCHRSVGQSGVRRNVYTVSGLGMFLSGKFAVCG